MKTILLCLLVAGLGLALPTARAQFPNFPAADKVLGAPDFTSVGTGAATASGISLPNGVAVDPTSGKLFVASHLQHRVLRFPDATALSNGANAEAVFGQVNFSGNSSGSTATKFAFPLGIHVDSQGRLWVADNLNHRVLMFIGASTFIGPPDRVFGQPDFTTTTSGTTPTKMNGPTAVFVDAADHLWVADSTNHRVLRFDNVSSLASGAAASAVFGQPDFTTNTSATSSVKMKLPLSVVVDGAGRLWVSDTGNHRLLRFDNAAGLGNGSAANSVLGQPDFTSAASGTTAQKLDDPAAITMDSAGTLFVADASNHRVLFFKNAAAKAIGAAADGVIGQSDFTSATSGTTDRRLNIPAYGLALDRSGGLWVSDAGNYRVVRFPADKSAAPPSLKGKAPKTTSAGTLALRGTAADGSGVASIKYRVGKGAFRKASGTTSWRLTARLKPGKNTIEIVMVDSVGNTSAARKVMVTRR